ncbi:hypothetical protein E3T46_04105 [Cryobacterium sp. Hh11]|uniref:PKD domain-containing protein n=1 Tax=Cryobacterium sp. Hh11 TaxID=2555868 RepID=UPI00106D9E32|nr:hypothetical protein [Cryobacterium sp. Hh11]TFD53142.1 hypothetical protein E3T46_04105 [Cryobacterium sp. Hh11]
MPQMFVAPATAQEKARLIATVELGVPLESPPDSDGIAHGNGVDLLAGYTSKTDGQNAGGKRSASGRGTGSARDLKRPAMCVSHKSTTEPSQWVPCNTGGLSDIVERHPQLLPTIAAPTAACPLCSAATIVRISDLQNFPAPTAPTGMEPNGWAIIGLAANFWTGASTHISEGILLGQPAQVMFTPISYHWNFGDGNTAISPNGGASWEALGLAEFTTTDTSHKYTAKGTYSIVLTINYHADYSFGDQGWRPVDGTITMPSAPFTVMAANESTVLVAEDCLTNPHGPGC